jgi:hypothetical protein
LNHEVNSFPACEVEWVGGRSPEVFFLNKHKQTVESRDIAEMNEASIAEMLQSKGIFTSTAKPNYVPPEFAPTAICRGWKQTGGCDPTGPREAMGDKDCYETVAHGSSGYCECIDRPNVEYGCEHTPLTCEQACSVSGADEDGGDEDFETEAGNEEEF